MENSTSRMRSLPKTMISYKLFSTLTSMKKGTGRNMLIDNSEIMDNVVKRSLNC